MYSTKLNRGIAIPLSASGQRTYALTIYECGIFHSFEKCPYTPPNGLIDFSRGYAYNDAPGFYKAFCYNSSGADYAVVGNLNISDDDRIRPHVNIITKGRD